MTITLISAAQFADLLGISVANARQRLWRAGLREQRGYDPAEIAREFGVTADKLADLPAVQTLETIDD